MSVPPGWSPDPFGRYAQRYWDGSAWTVHVVSANGTQMDDPMGVSVAVPFAMPASAMGAHPAAAAPTSAVQSLAASPFSKQAIVSALGTGTSQRQTPTLRGAFGTLGGAGLSIGASAVAIGSSDNRLAIAIVGLALMGIAAGLRLRFAAHPDVRAGSVAALATGSVVAAIGIGNDNASWVALIVGVFALAAWLLPPWQGHPFLLGLSVFTIVLSVGRLIAEATKPSLFDDFGDDLIRVPGFGISSQTAGAYFLLATTALTYLAFRADKRQHLTISTPLLVSAMASSLTAVGYLALDEGAKVAYLLAGVAGIALAVVASRGNHRASLWFGATMAAVGLAAFVFSVANAGSPRIAGFIGCIVGALVLFGPRLYKALYTAVR